MLGFFKLGLNNICFIVLANTLHSLGFSARVRDALWFFRWSLRALKNDKGMLGFYKRGHNCTLC